MNMKKYQYNYLIIYLYNYADIVIAFKDTVRLCIKVPYTLLTPSFPSLESINGGLEAPLYKCVFYSKILHTAEYMEGSEKCHSCASLKLEASQTKSNLPV